MEKLELVLYKIAKRDLTASRVLYRSEHYPQSLFYLQQSVEKSNKAYGLLEGVVQEHELQSKIGHDPMNIYKKSIEFRRADIEKSLLSISRYPKAREHELFGQMIEHRKDMVSGQQFLESLKKHSQTKLTYDDLNFILDQLEEMEKEEVSIPEDINTLFDSSFGKVLSFYEAIGTSKAIDSKVETEKFIADPNNRSQIIKVIKDSIPKLVDLAFINYTLYFSAIVTMPHAIRARYPYSDTKFNPLKEYNLHYPLINLQPYFMRALSKAYKKMPGIYPILEKKQLPLTFLKSEDHEKEK